MKSVQLLILCLLINTLTFAQKADFYPAYIMNAESGATLIKENSLRIKNVNAVLFLADYPVLNAITEFHKKQRYSIINVNLVVGKPKIKRNKLIFTLVNGKKYKIKIKNRVFFNPA